MHDARDAEDSRLLEANDRATLLATYYPVIVERCRVRLPDPDACEVAHRVVERLLREIAAAKRYGVPYRVVVHMVTEWKLKEFFTRGRVEVELDEDEAEAPNPFEDFEQGHDLGLMFAGLPERAREVLRLITASGRDLRSTVKRSISA